MFFIERKFSAGGLTFDNGGKIVTVDIDSTSGLSKELTDAVNNSERSQKTTEFCPVGTRKTSQNDKGALKIDTIRPSFKDKSCSTLQGMVDGIVGAITGNDE